MVLGSALAAILMASSVTLTAPPTRGESYRAIATDKAAFEEADTDRNGKVSDHEFEVYHANQGAYDRRGRVRVGGPIADTNADGAFTPDELYTEARNFERDGYPGDDTNRRRRDDYYGNPYSE